MSFLFDSNAFIALLNRTSKSLTTRLQQVTQRRHAVYASSVVVFELRFGANGSRDPSRSHARIDYALSNYFTNLEFDDEDARKAAEIRAELKRLGTPIGAYDVLIAGQALRHGMTLVTANLKEFQRVPGLNTENWL